MAKPGAPKKLSRDLRDGGRPWLPPGYFLRGYGRLLSNPEEPAMWNIYRPDGAPIAVVSSGNDRESLEHDAWVDCRRQALEILDGAGCGSGMPEGYGLFEDQGEWLIVRPDGSVVSTFSLFTTADRTARAAWDDYRRRTLRLVRPASSAAGNL